MWPCNVKIPKAKGPDHLGKMVLGICFTWHVCHVRENRHPQFFLSRSNDIKNGRWIVSVQFFVSLRKFPIRNVGPANGDFSTLWRTGTTNSDLDENPNKPSTSMLPSPSLNGLVREVGHPASLEQPWPHFVSFSCTAQVPTNNISYHFEDFSYLPVCRMSRSFSR